jgi:hypothetical protein
MNYTSQRNEIAGQAEQKLPPPAVSALTGADAGDAPSNSGAKMPLSFSWHETPAQQFPILDIPTKAASPLAHPAETPANATAPPAPLDRLERIISTEAATLRQTGAQTLGVSLKVDANTRLYLELTARDGQVRAAVRCEHGSFSADDAQWAQLRQSLALRNVQLLPLGGSGSLDLPPPSDPQERPFSSLRDGWPAAGAAAPRQQKERHRSRRNWESWA